MGLSVMDSLAVVTVEGTILRPLAQTVDTAGEFAQVRQDLGYSFRRLSRAPGLVFTVVVSIALGIAANSTIFSMISRFVFRPAPVAVQHAAGGSHDSSMERVL